MEKQFIYHAKSDSTFALVRVMHLILLPCRTAVWWPNTADQRGYSGWLQHGEGAWPAQEVCSQWYPAGCEGQVCVFVCPDAWEVVSLTSMYTSLPPVLEKDGNNENVFWFKMSFFIFCSLFLRTQIHLIFAPSFSLMQSREYFSYQSTYPFSLPLSLGSSLLSLTFNLPLLPL